MKSYIRILPALFLPCALWVTLSIARDSSKDIVASVNGLTITEQQLQAAVQQRLPQTAYHQQLSADRISAIRDQALQDLIEEELIYQDARSKKLQVSVLQIEQQLSEMKQGYESEEQFQLALRHSGMNSLGLMASIERRLLIQQLLSNEVTSHTMVSDQNLADYYHANTAKFTVPEQYHLSQILIAVAPGAMADGWQAGQDSARKVVIHLRNGEDFTQMAKQVSDDSTTCNNGGDLGWFHKGHLIPELQDAIEGTATGVITDPIRSIYGFHVFRIEGSKPSRVMQFEEINLEELRSTLTRRRVERRRKEFIDALRSRASIEIRARDKNSD